MRKLNKSKDKRKPILLHTLHAFLRALDSVTTSRYDRCMFKAIFLTMFYAFLRVGEVATTSNKSQEHLLRRTNVTLFKRNSKLSSMTITFDTFKHNLKRPVTIKIPARKANICPVAHMAAYLAMRGDEEGPLFRDSSKKAITPHTIGKMIRTCALACNLDPTNFKPHSFRIGAATTCAQRGIPYHIIQQLGRWSSNAYLNYIGCPTFIH